MTFRRLSDVPGPTGLAAQYSLFRQRLQMGEVLREISQQHGDVARVPILGAPKVLLSHPEDIQEVLATKAAAFRLSGQNLLRKLFPWGVVATEGPVHDENRAHLVLAMRKVLSRRIPELTLRKCQQGLASFQEGQVVDLYELTRQVTLAMSAAMLFPSEAEHLLLGQIDQEAFLRIVSNVNGWFLGIPTTLQKLVLLAQLPHTLKIMRLRRRVKGQLRETIQKVQAMQTGGSPADALTLLTDGSEVGGPMPAEFLTDNLMNLLLAGYETTANVMAWAMWEAAHREEVQTHLAREGSRLSPDPEQNIEWINNSPWTDATIQEALRMYPSGWALARQSLFEFRLRDYLFERGTIFITSQWVTHRDMRWFPQPGRFLPERWLEGSSQLAETSAAATGTGEGQPPREKRHPFAFFPFGGGKRFCLGKAIFDFEGALLLGSLFREWRLEPVEGCHPRPRFHATMLPDRPPLVVLRRR